eukprot:CAMPEP_0181181354 /NCGR_PEP_ID=MMETSP1096-20121128/7291_1 /TAXON_ID=156174 ORGANISM="Chrysochromulina ericina, Strain CCMP281" /NCGR_SAMPLE_ID=MMETSP1096 /ASSEMBLY_ACC=CAM_ASM_000453 /LENGTH=82 /DNA_ID=CAMNT_0023269849 /DNA_START=702 /DNA_END=950 /DNA_ORIENTATION=-
MPRPPYRPPCRGLMLLTSRYSAVLGRREDCVAEALPDPVDGDLAPIVRSRVDAIGQQHGDDPPCGVGTQQSPSVSRVRKRCI